MLVGHTTRLYYPKQNASEALYFANTIQSYGVAIFAHLPPKKETTTSLDFAMKKLSACAPFRNTNQVDVPNVLKDNKIVMTKDSKHKRDKIAKTVLAPHLTKELQLCQGHVLPGFDFFFKMFVEMSVNRHGYNMCQL